MKINAIIVVIFAIVFTSQLPGEDGFETAHCIDTQFWNDAMQVQKTDLKAREDIRQRAAALPDVLRPLLSKGILEYLNDAARPSSDALKGKLSYALKSEGGVEDVISNSSHDVFVVVYTVAYCASCSTSWLGIFRQSQGQWRLAAHIENPAVDSAVHLAWIGPKASPLLVLYGVHWGDAHNRLDVRMYVLENQRLRPVWSLLNQPRGAIAVQGKRVTITSDTTLAPPFFRKQQNFVVIGDRVKLLHTTVANTPE